MKGTFSLNVHDMYILFGQLGTSSYQDTEQFAVGILDVPTREGDGRLIAHDVVEHTVSHRTKAYVTVAEELRALGATKFVRAGHAIDIKYDIQQNLYYVDLTDRKPMPPRRDMGLEWAKYSLSLDELNQDIPEEDFQYWLNWVDAQLNYGYWQKHHQYAGDYYRAEQDFIKIQNWAEHALEQLKDKHWSGVQGLTCAFDTTRNQFNTRCKYAA